jgi:mRNA interferase MazF
MDKNGKDIKPMFTQVRKGDVYYVDLPNVGGSVQFGARPCVVISNDVGNLHSPVLLVSPLTSRKIRRGLPTHVYLKGDENNLDRDSVALLEQVTTVPKSSLRAFITHLHESKMHKINEAIAISFGLAEPTMQVQPCFAGA